MKITKQEPLTDSQARYYDAIVALLENNRVFPSIREIQNFLSQTSPLPTQMAIQHLVDKCWIERVAEAGTPRAYRLAPVVRMVTSFTDSHGRGLAPGSYEVTGAIKGYWTPAEAVRSNKLTSG